MKHLILFALIALTACTGETTETPALHAPAKAVSADGLYDAYTGNELAAERDFGKTPIRVTGEVETVSENVVMLTTDKDKGGMIALKMLPGYADVLIELKPGRQFSADCERTLYLLTVITPQECRPSEAALAQTEA